VAYSAGRKGGSGGGNKLIILGPVEAQIVADAIEDGLSLTKAMRLVNKHRAQCDPALWARVRSFLPAQRSATQSRKFT